MTTKNSLRAEISLLKKQSAKWEAMATTLEAVHQRASDENLDLLKQNIELRRDLDLLKSGICLKCRSLRDEQGKCRC